jgi:hypothetical protein
VWRRVDPLFQTINLIREEHPNRCCAPSNAMAKAIDERSQPSIHSRSDFPSIGVAHSSSDSINPIARSASMTFPLRYRTNRRLKTRRAGFSPHRVSLRRTWSTLTSSSRAMSFRDRLSLILSFDDQSKVHPLPPSTPADRRLQDHRFSGLHVYICHELEARTPNYS